MKSRYYNGLNSGQGEGYMCADADSAHIYGVDGYHGLATPSISSVSRSVSPTLESNSIVLLMTLPLLSR